VAREEKIPDQEKPKVIESEDSAYKFFVIDNALTTEFAGKRWKIEPKVDLPIGTLGVAIDERGLVKATKFGGQVVEAGYIQASGPNVTMLTKPTFTVSGGGTSMNPALAWGLIVGLTVAIYGLGRFILTFTLPRPVLDVDRGFKWESIRQNLLQTLVIIGAFLAGVIAAGNVLKFIGTGLAATIGNAESPNKVLKEIATWRLAPEVMQAELMWFIGCVVLCVGLVIAGKGLLKDTEMETSFKAFLGQSGIMAILAFMLFYRFPEAMVGRISNLFYLDPTTKGGLGMSAEQVGIVSGTMGVIGIVLGGIAGGLTLSRLGLRKAFWPLALAMHVPNFLYLWAFYNKPIIPLGAGFNEVIFSPISIIVFVDQFGYGYGFAAYMVYLMWVAQRGRFQTSHYAIGTGLGALFIAAAGILSGQIQKNYGFDGVYWTVVALAIPGLLVLKAIPLDEHEGRNIKVEEIGD
jgi:PAT family beta-lactamase induction signal transducer AmpG